MTVIKFYKSIYAIIIIFSLTFGFLSSIKASESLTLNSANLGRTYDGLGAIETYGKLLYDYPEQQRNEILDYIFLPNYGASLQILKMTIGCDGNDVGGSWPSHRRSLDEPLNFNRGYGWWLMKEAKKRNPNIQLSALNWGYPGYATTDELKAQFIYEYVKGARDEHGLVLDHIGGNQNESIIRPGVTKLLRQKLDDAGLESVKIIAADEGARKLNYNIIPTLQNDPDYAAVVDIIGVHYKGRDGDDPIMNGIFDFGKPVWSTEDGGGSYQNRNSGYGWASQIMKLLHDVKITGIIRWLITASTYENMPWPNNGFMKTNEPWSGRYIIGSNMWTFSHFTQFIDIGWKMLVTPDTYLYRDGTSKGGRFVAYKSPVSDDYSIVIDTYEGNVRNVPSNGIDLEINLEGELSKDDVQIWRSDFSTNNESFIHIGSASVVNNKISVHLDKGCLYTISTTKGQNKGETVSPVYKSFPIPYTDDFENYEYEDLPNYFVNANGAFDIAPAGGGREGKVLRQTASKSAILWHPNSRPVAQPLTAIGDINWSNYEVQVDVLLEKAGRVLLGGRVDGMSVNSGDYEVQGYYLMLNNSGSWALCRKDIAEDFTILKTGAISDFDINKWATLKLSFKNDLIGVYIGSSRVAEVQDNTYSKGHIAIATMDIQAAGLIASTLDYVTAQFDNLHIGHGTADVQTVYYVSPDGDNSNTGLSPDLPFQTIERVFEVEASPSTNTDIVINLDRGTYSTTQISPAFDRLANVSLVGESAATTIVESASVTDFRFFQLQPSTNAGLKLKISDVTIQNFGRTDKKWAGAVVLMNGSGDAIKAEFLRCVFKNNVASRGAIIQSSNASYAVLFESCYFENCKSFDFGTNPTNLEAMIYVTGGSLSMKNCVFNNNTKDPLFENTDRDLKKGTLLTINPINSRVNAVIVNNTFFNNKVENGKELAVSIQPAITIADLSVPKKLLGIDLVLLNNLFIENKRIGFDQDVDIYIDPTDIIASLVSNNIFNKTTTSNASIFFSTATNKISSVYTYTSSEIDFEMNGNLPKIEQSELGVPYALPKGIEIVGKGISNDIHSWVPVNDIRNRIRKSPPDIGATDYSNSTSSLSQYNSGINVYTKGKSLNVFNKENSSLFIRIFDITGRQIYTSRITSNYFFKTFDMSGIYIVAIESNGGIIERKVVLLRD